MDAMMSTILEIVADSYDEYRPGAGDCIRKQIAKVEPDEDEHPLDRAEREHNEDQDAGLEGMPDYQS